MGSARPLWHDRRPPVELPRGGRPVAPAAVGPGGDLAVHDELGVIGGAGDRSDLGRIIDVRHPLQRCFRRWLGEGHLLSIVRNYFSPKGENYLTDSVEVTALWLETVLIGLTTGLLGELLGVPHELVIDEIAR